MPKYDFESKNEHFLIKTLKKFQDFEDGSIPAKKEAGKIIKTINRSDLRKSCNQKKIFNKINDLIELDKKDCNMCDIFQGTSADLGKKWRKSLR